VLLTENTEKSKSWIGVKGKAIEKVSTESHVDEHEEIDQ
jgi:hypothetical protein